MWLSRWCGLLRLSVTFFDLDLPLEVFREDAQEEEESEEMSSTETSSV